MKSEGYVNARARNTLLSLSKLKIHIYRKLTIKSPLTKYHMTLLYPSNTHMPYLWTTFDAIGGSAPFAGHTLNRCDHEI